MHIKFNEAPRVANDIEYMKQSLDSGRICGDGVFSKKCEKWLEENTQCYGALMTTSGTQALEMAALMADIKPGDEVIMPSFTFVSTANAFVLRGAKIVFVDIRPDTMNIDEKLIENAITSKTKAIVPVHYAGVGCEMDRIMQIAKENDLYVIEDAAQGVMSSYKGKALGSIGQFGCVSFHETKNYSMGEGGAILINDASKVEEAEIIREKGTDRKRFLRGQIDKYSWVMEGSSYLPSDINAAYLWAQLEIAQDIYDDRMASWDRYKNELSGLEQNGDIEFQHIPEECIHNAHMFYIKAADIKERTSLIDHLNKNDISAVFHYVPLHSSEAGKKFGVMCGEDKYTTKESERLLRLPLYYGLDKASVEKIAAVIKEYYQK